MKNIMLLIHDDAGQEARLRAALDVTRAIDGHLICLEVNIVPPVAGDSVGGGGGGLVIELERATEAANRARIEPRIGREGVTWSWSETTCYLEPAIEEAVALADLVVVNRLLDGPLLPGTRGIAGRLLAKTAKPILAVPEAVTGCAAKGAALVAWDGSPEARSALAAAVPLLALAHSVTIIEIDDGSVTIGAEMAASTLSRHGIRARIERHPPGALDTGPMLLAEANGAAFDYIVMGGYGHHRLTEALFGGVTRTLLRESRIPLFLAH